MHRIGLDLATQAGDAQVYGKALPEGIAAVREVN
jgi:hypothetical protein